MAADITPFIKDAQQVEKETGIPASITLGQIIVESSGKYAGGLSGLAAQAKNLFGIKGTGTAGSVTMQTKEYRNGQWVSVPASFRKYNSFYESMKDHAKFLSGQRYQAQFKDAKSVNDYAYGLQKAGYATSPTYANSLLGIINTNNLHQYDGSDLAYKPVASSGDTTSTGSTDTSAAAAITQTVVRVLLLILIAVVGVVLFLQAFPVQDVAMKTIDAVPNPVKNTVKTVVKKAVTKGAK